MFLTPSNAILALPNASLALRNVPLSLQIATSTLRDAALTHRIATLSLPAAAVSLRAAHLSFLFAALIPCGLNKITDGYQQVKHRCSTGAAAKENVIVARGIIIPGRAAGGKE